MTTATGDISIDFSGLANANPYSPAELETIQGTLQIAGGVLRSTSGLAIAVTADSPTQDTVESSVEIGGSGSNDSVYAMLLNSTGDGYAVRSTGFSTTVQEVAGYVVGGGIGGPLTVAKIADVITVRYTVSTSVFVVLINGAPARTTTVDPIVGLKAGLGHSPDNTGAFGIASWAANGYASGPDYTQRKGSTFDVTHGLGTITSATLDGNAITINSTGAGTVNLTDNSGITTSGEYDLVLDDGSSTETYTVQLNVVGLPSFTINKDGGAQAGLTDVEFIVMTGAEGSRVIADQITGVTTDANGDTGIVEVTDLGLEADDTVFIVQHSSAVDGGVPYEATLVEM